MLFGYLYTLYMDQSEAISTSTTLNVACVPAVRAF